MSGLYMHPLTGALLDANDANGLNTACVETREAIGRLYRLEQPLVERLAELRGPAVLPKRRHMTDKQAKVDRCPRCSARIRADEAA